MFFKKDDKNTNFVKVAALLIHAAKIDENFSQKEEEIINQALLNLGADNQSSKEILKKGKILEGKILIKF